MATLDIIHVPDPLLKTVSTEVETVDDDIRRLLHDMADTMYAAPGIGLSAIQVAIPKRIVVMDTREPDGETPPSRRPRFFINPRIVWSSEEMSVYNEGCLSIPEHYAEIERPAEVRVAYLDENGDPQEQVFSGLDATCLQHEIDHLDGRVFIDYLSKLKRTMIVKKVAKMDKSATTL